MPGLGGDDDRDAALDEDPQHRRQLRIERAGTQQFHDGTRRRGLGRLVAAARPLPPQLRCLWQPLEGFRRALELDDPDAWRQEVQEGAEERGFADLPGLGGNDDRDAAFDEDP